MYKNEISEYNSIGICKFGLNKILHTREAISLMNNNLPYNLIPKGFMGIFVINKTFDEIIKIASEKAVNFVINGTRYLAIPSLTMLVSISSIFHIPIHEISSHISFLDFYFLLLEEVF